MRAWLVTQMADGRRRSPTGRASTRCRARWAARSGSACRMRSDERAPLAARPPARLPRCASPPSPSRSPRLVAARARRRARPGSAALDMRQLQHPDEGRYAEIAREMAVSGDWVTPRLNDLKYFEKPPLQYWLGAATFDALGVNEWTARLPTAVAGFLAVLAVGFTGGAAGRSRRRRVRRAGARRHRLARRARALPDARFGAVVLHGARAVRVPARAARRALARRASATGCCVAYAAAAARDADQGIDRARRFRAPRSSLYSLVTRDSGRGGGCTRSGPRRSISR